jgi:hypothetical protein
MKVLLFSITLLFISSVTMAAPSKKPPRSKFYDFSQQVIDGEIKRPTGIYTDARQRAKFERLLTLKKSFLPQLFKTAKEKVFK